MSSGAAAIDAALSNRFTNVDASLAAYDGQVRARQTVMADAPRAQLPRFMWGLNLPC